MDMYQSDKDFMVGGVPYPDFPLLINNDGAVVEDALLYLVDEMIERRRGRDDKTVEKYGRVLYDYFGYLEARGRAWDECQKEGDVSSLAHYIRWCESEVGNENGYINDKVRVIEKLYKWGVRTGRLTELPFGHVRSRRRRGGMLAHLSSEVSGNYVSDKRLPEMEKPIKVLSRRQIDMILRRAMNPTTRAVVHLGLNAGLRGEELATFPESYVQDCSALPRGIKTVPVYLNAGEMDIKNDKNRTVRVSVPCMNILWQYRNTTRVRLTSSSVSTNGRLFLTRYGVPYVADGFEKPLARLGKQVGFHIHCHMLRHTFATHTLSSLEDLKAAGRLRSSPLVVLMKLLGHASITTTSRYLDFSDVINDEYGTAYQSEIDAVAYDVLKSHRHGE